MTSLHASRRAVIGALSTMPLAMCARPAPAIAKKPAEWSALIAEKDKALAAFDLAFDAHSDAQQRYYDTRPEEPRAFVKANAVDENGVIFFDVEQYRADWEAAKQAHKEADMAAYAASGWEKTEAEQDALSEAHTAIMDRIISFPTTDLEIIAEKLDLCIREYGDENGAFARVLASLKGGVA